MLKITLLFLSFLFHALQPRFQQIDKGVEHSIYIFDKTVPVHVFKIDPKLIELKVIIPKRANHIKQIVESSNAIGGVNANFFTPKFKVLGLVISEKKVIYPVRHVDWGVFFIKKGKPKLVYVKNFSLDPDIEFAVQAGPRLISNNALIKVKHQFAKRTVIGNDAEGKIYIIITEKSVYLDQFETNFLSKTLKLKNALNLDGGSSSQAFFKTDKFTLNIYGSNRIPSAIGLFQRKLK